MQKPCLFTSAGKELAATLQIPKRRSARPLPAVLFCHGFTGNRIEARRLFVRLARELEKRGIASLRFDYRGCGESAGEFEEFTIQDYIRDSCAALRFLASRRAVNSKRLGVLGYSMGGCVASYVAGECNVPVRSVALWAPVAEPQKTFYENREDLRLNVDRVKSLPYIDHCGWRIGRNFILGLKELDPVSVLPRATAPVLLCHGIEDEVVPAEASRLYEKQLRQNGVSVEKLLLEGAGHNFSSVEIDRKLFATTVDWFIKTLK
jgi:dipeptidyl aminopeptidase/acylaminoacyl peptidase